jgi:histidyl-tRNA synthetase
LINSAGLSTEEQSALLDRILDGEIKALTEIKTKNKAVIRNISALIGMQVKSGNMLKNLKSLSARELPGIIRPLDDFISIVELLENLGIDYKIDIDSGRGFEYYTGFVFRLSVKGERVGGGGRYDALVPLMSGKNIPASGFALSLDRLMNMVTADRQNNPGVIISLTGANKNSVKSGFAMAEFLHHHGIKAEMDIGKHPPDFNWNVKINSPSDINLLNKKNKKQYKVNNSSEILEILRNEKTSKNRSTQRSSSR